ncbi:MAG: STM3941 family protein [Micropepsaceae bacterium]
MLQNILLTLIGLGFVALSILPMAAGKIPWTSPDPWSGLLFFAGCAVVGIAEIVQSRRPAKAEVTGTRVVLRYDRVRLAALGLASAGWLAAGIVGLSGAMFPGWLSWVLIAFAGLCAVVLLPAGLDGRPKIVVDAEGIADYRRLTQKVAWGDLASIGTSYARGVPAVMLRLRDPGSFSAKRRTLGRLLGHTIDPFHINAFNLDGSLGDVEEAIQRFAPPELLPKPVEDWEYHDDDEDEL